MLASPVSSFAWWRASLLTAVPQQCGPGDEIISYARPVVHMGGEAAAAYQVHIAWMRERVDLVRERPDP
jgi:hypothetical protein